MLNLSIPSYITLILNMDIPYVGGSVNVLMGGPLEH